MKAQASKMELRANNILGRNSAVELLVLLCVCLGWSGEEDFTPTCSGFAGTSSPLKGEEEVERTLESTPTAPPCVGAASPLEGEAERGELLFLFTLRGSF